MSFLKRLFGGRIQPSATTEPQWKIVVTDGRGRSIEPLPTKRRTSDHPNAPYDEPLPDRGAPERFTWVTPDGIVVLARGPHIRLNGTTKEDVQAALKAVRAADFASLRIERHNGEIKGVSAYARDRYIGTLPRRWVDETVRILEPWGAKGWEVRCRVSISTFADSTAEGAPRTGDGLVAEVQVPVGPYGGDEKYADAYEASYAFPRAQVQAPWKAPEKQAELDAWFEANKAPERELVLIRVGGVTMECHKLPWRGAEDSGRETQLYQPIDPATSSWMPRGEVPDEVAAVGGQIVAVAGTTHHSGVNDLGFALGSPVLLRREPGNQYDRNAIAILTANGQAQAGYIPNEIAVKLAPIVDRGDPIAGIVCWEAREGKRRIGLRLLVGPSISIGPG